MPNGTRNKTANGLVLPEGLGDEFDDVTNWQVVDEFITEQKASGAGSGSVAVQDEGTQVAAAAARLNFRGAGVTASSDGAGGVNVDVPGASVAVQPLTSSRALTSTDNGATLVYSGASDIVLTVPAGLASGYSATVVQQGSGVVTFAQGGGVGFDNVGSTRGQGTFSTIVQVSADQYAFQNPVPNAPVTLIQTAIPFISFSSWTFGANGALTLAVALPNAFPAAYVYFPADAIASGVPAGWYYTVFSSTTAGTVYNNRYTSGKPTIPSTPTAFATSAGSVTTQVTTAVTAVIATLPGGSLGPNGALRTEALWQANNSAASKAVSVLFGAGAQLTNQALSGSNVYGEVESKTLNTGVANRQNNRAATVNSQTGAINYTTVDTTQDQPIYATQTLGTAATGDYVILARLRVTYEFRG